MLSWRARKQLVVLLILGSVVAAIIGVFAYRYWPAPSCVDQKMNQREEGIDCGGPCVACAVKTAKSPVVFWTRAIELRPGFYDVAAEIQNQNIGAAAARITYEFALVDRVGVMSTRVGTTFLYPQERAAVVETSIEAPRGVATGVEFRVVEVEWVASRESLPKVVVEQRVHRIAEDGGTLRSMVEADIFNDSPLGFRDVEVLVLALDASESVIGINKVIIAKLDAGSRAHLRALWPRPLVGEVVRLRVDPRVNIFNPATILRPQ